MHVPVPLLGPQKNRRFADPRAGRHRARGVLSATAIRAAGRGAPGLSVLALAGGLALALAYTVVETAGTVATSRMGPAAARGPAGPTGIGRTLISPYLSSMAAESTVKRR